jgi:cell division septum initiation protein DivIVA
MQPGVANSLVLAETSEELQMSEFEGPSVKLDQPVRQRSIGARFGDLGDRLSRAVGTVQRPTAEGPALLPSGNFGDVEDQEPVLPEEPLASRFPFAWRGYDRAAVDEHIAELERDVEALRAQTRSRSSVVEEIERIGDQTTAILQVAHEQAAVVTGRARAAAERVVAEAQSQANAITDAAQRQLNTLDSETDSVWRERARLIADVHKLADGLLSLAEHAADRFPAEPELAEQSASPAPDPATARANGASSEPRDASQH